LCAVWIVAFLVVAATKLNTILSFLTMAFRTTISHTFAIGPFTLSYTCFFIGTYTVRFLSVAKNTLSPITIKTAAFAAFRHIIRAVWTKANWGIINQCTHTLIAIFTLGWWTWRMNTHTTLLTIWIGSNTLLTILTFLCTVILVATRINTPKDTHTLILTTL